MKLTSEILHSAGSYGGNGFNKAQLSLLGVEWPPKKGWLIGLIGTEFDEARWATVLRLSGVRLKKERAKIMREIVPQQSPDLDAQAWF